MSKCYKITYQTLDEARVALHKSFKLQFSTRRSKNRCSKRPLYAYNCKLCGLYHLTSKKYDQALM